MPVTDTFVLGADPQGQPVSQALRLTNRHGLVAGATGTGKTVTLQRLAELFSDAGVAVFAADIKGISVAWALRAILRARWPNVSPACPGCITSPRPIR